MAIKVKQNTQEIELELSEMLSQVGIEIIPPKDNDEEIEEVESKED